MRPTVDTGLSDLPEGFDASGVGRDATETSVVSPVQHYPMMPTDVNPAHFAVNVPSVIELNHDNLIYGPTVNNCDPDAIQRPTRARKIPLRYQ